MSTNISNGYRLPNMTMANLAEFMESYRQACHAELGCIVARKMVEHMAHAIDTAAVRDEPVPDGVVAEAYQAVLAAHRNSPGTSALAGNLRCEVMFHPPTDSRYVFARLHTFQDEYRVLFESQPGVKPYPYWDHSDPPDDVSRAQWELRGTKWRSALGTSEFGFRGVAVGDHDIWPPTREMLLSAAMPLDKRVARIARDLTIKELTPEPVTLEGVMHAIGSLNSTDAGADVLRRNEQKVREKLDPNALTRAVSRVRL